MEWPVCECFLRVWIVRVGEFLSSVWFLHMVSCLASSVSWSGSHGPFPKHNQRSRISKAPVLIASDMQDVHFCTVESCIFNTLKITMNTAKWASVIHSHSWNGMKREITDGAQSCSRAVLLGSLFCLERKKTLFLQIFAVETKLSLAARRDFSGVFFMSGCLIFGTCFWVEGSAGVK